MPLVFQMLGSGKELLQTGKMVEPIVISRMPQYRRYIYTTICALHADNQLSCEEMKWYQGWWVMGQHDRPRGGQKLIVYLHGVNAEAARLLFCRELEIHMDVLKQSVHRLIANSYCQT